MELQVLDVLWMKRASSRSGQGKFVNEARADSRPTSAATAPVGRGDHAGKSFAGFVHSLKTFACHPLIYQLVGEIIPRAD